MNAKTRLTHNRLLKLAAHLEGPNRGLDEFDFTFVHYKTDCGAAGCAIGELPYCFPRFFFWRGDGPDEACSFPALRSARSKTSVEAAQHFFGLGILESAHLFYPAHQCKIFGGRKLYGDATPKQVARNIRIFCAKLAKGEITLQAE